MNFPATIKLTIIMNVKTYSIERFVYIVEHGIGTILVLCEGLADIGPVMPQEFPMSNKKRC